MSDDSSARVVKKSRMRTIARGFRRLVLGNKQAIAGFIIVSIFLITALSVATANLLHVQITPYNPIKQNVGPLLAPPSLRFPFGTDSFGRDLFSRVIAATPNDVGIGLAVVGFGATVGIIIGSLAALRGGMVEELLMRGTDAMFALPALIIAMAIGVAWGPSITHMAVALMIIWWPAYARLSRGEALKVAHQNYIAAARLSGLKTVRIVFKHVIPNITSTILVYATLDVGTVVLVYAGLSYLGLSVTPPAPDWGQMVSAYYDYLQSAPWLPLFPGFVIAMGVVGFSLLGDGIRDALQAR
jgi:peptide/nickel transport system permease protein